jgi:hypothetical protein
MIDTWTAVEASSWENLEKRRAGNRAGRRSKNAKNPVKKRLFRERDRLQFQQASI